MVCDHKLSPWCCDHKLSPWCCERSCSPKNLSNNSQYFTEPCDSGGSYVDNAVETDWLKTWTASRISIQEKEVIWMCSGVI